MTLNNVQQYEKRIKSKKRVFSKKIRKNKKLRKFVLKREKSFKSEDVSSIANSPMYSVFSEHDKSTFGLEYQEQSLFQEHIGFQPTQNDCKMGNIIYSIELEKGFDFANRGSPSSGKVNDWSQVLNQSFKEISPIPFKCSVSPDQSELKKIQEQFRRNQHRSD